MEDGVSLHPQFFPFSILYPPFSALPPCTLIDEPAMNRAILYPLSSILLFAGCTVGPNYQRPDVPLPDHFGATTRPATEHVDFARWWTNFNDPQLDSLIDRAVAGNLDLKTAAARVREARAQRGVVAADRGLQVGSNATYRRSRTSEN